MRIDLKNTKIAARRVIQGGAAFAALGALSIATALPAAADTTAAGWAYATVGEGELGDSITYITPQGQSDSASNAFSGNLDDHLVIDASTSASVNGNGVSSTVTVNSAQVQLTAADIDRILEDIEEEPKPSPEPSPSESPIEESPEPSPSPGAGDDTDGDDTDSGTEDDDTDGDGTDGDDTKGDDTKGDDTDGDDTDSGVEDDDTEGDDEAGGTEPSPSPSASENQDGGEAAGSTSIELTEEDTELSANGEEIVFDATLSGASVTTTYGWNGEVSHDFNPGTVSYAVNTAEGEMVQSQDKGLWDSEEEGYDWDSAFTALLLDITVPPTDDQQGISGNFVLGVSYASYGIASEDDGNGGNGGGGGNDEKPQQSRDTEELKKPVVKPTEALATTGSPVGGLIAAGAAIAAGGGAAAYLARRKKTAVEAPAEENDN
ncbi:cell wall protein [Nocardiopsis sp. CC223A]|uniref:cell wall protein n=1 Tax=Nocardiopsis sp. CC223A TaxID=3044051 RepID=UPI00278BE4FE|nr:cell wall protein [Nocardiopsis sp. CC223A]